MHCELCGMELTMADNYRITGYVNRPNGIPRNIYVHQDAGCKKAQDKLRDENNPQSGVGSAYSGSGGK